MRVGRIERNWVNQLSESVTQRSYERLQHSTREDSFSPEEIIRRKKAQVKEGTRDGVAMGFMAGCAISVAGLPLAVTIVLDTKGKLSKKNSDFLYGIFTPLALPGLFSGALAAGFGAIIGNVRARLKSRPTR